MVTGDWVCPGPNVKKVPYKGKSQDGFREGRVFTQPEVVGTRVTFFLWSLHGENFHGQLCSGPRLTILEPDFQNSEVNSNCHATPAVSS